MRKQKDSLVLVRLATSAVRKGVQVLVDLHVSRVFTRDGWLESRARLTFLAKCSPRLCGDHRDGGMGAAAPTGFSAWLNAREGVQLQAMHAAFGMRKGIDELSAAVLSEMR